jgi:uncharacterized protein YktA (UPF0223 family)
MEYKSAVTFSIQGNHAYLRYAVISIGNLILRNCNPKNIYIGIHSSLIDRQECIELYAMGVNIIFSENISKFVVIDQIYLLESKYEYVIHIDVDCSYSGSDFYSFLNSAIDGLNESDCAVCVQRQDRTNNIISLFDDRINLFKGVNKGNKSFVTDVFNSINGYDEFIEFLTETKTWIYGGIILLNLNKYKRYKHIVNLLDALTYCDETVLMHVSMFDDFLSIYNFNQRVCDPDLDFKKITNGFNHFSSVVYRKSKEKEINDEYLYIKNVFNLFKNNIAM